MAVPLCLQPGMEVLKVRLQMPPSDSPCCDLPRCGRVFCARKGRRHVRPQRAVRRRRVSGSPLYRGLSRRGEGLPGYGTVLFVRALVEHPAGYDPLLAQFAQGVIIAFDEIQHSRHPGSIGFGAAVPRPARSHAYASQNVFPRTAQGLLPARAGSPLTGQDSHLLDDERSFMVASHPPIPFDPQGLVALNFLYVFHTASLFLRHNALRIEIADTATLGAGLLVNHGVH